MTDDQYLLASAYADGDVSADERAAAEADPDVMAEVARIRELRAALADVAPASDAVRTAMLAAALRDFRPTTAVAAPPRPARVPRAFPWSNVLGLAAAAVAVVAIGAVVVNGMGGQQGDDDAAMSTEAAEAPSATELSRTFEAADEAELDQATAAAEAADSAPAAPAPAGGAPAATEAPAGTDAAPTNPSSALTIVIEDPDQLAGAGLALRDAYQAGVSGAAPPVTDCTLATAAAAPTADATPGAAAVREGLPDSAANVELLDTAEFRLPAGDVVTVWLAVDLGSAQTYAIDAANCVLVGIGTAP